MDDTTAALLVLAIILSTAAIAGVAYMSMRNTPVKRRQQIMISRNASGQIDAIIET